MRCNKFLTTWRNRHALRQEKNKAMIKSDKIRICKGGLQNPFSDAPDAPGDGVLCFVYMRKKGAAHQLYIHASHDCANNRRRGRKGKKTRTRLQLPTVKGTYLPP